MTRAKKADGPSKKPATPEVRCAIYTRKSTEERLDLEYNSLDAQRDAALAYIASQRHEGWKAVDEQYDDGGFSGGNADRESVISTVMDRASESTGTNSGVLDPDRLELIVRRQIRAENKTYLSDDVLVAAYQQTGSIRKAATILSQQTQVTISKDRVARAVERAGGAVSIRHAPQRKYNSRLPR